MDIELATPAQVAGDFAATLVGLGITFTAMALAASWPMALPALAAATVGTTTL